jgi:hypothetical protein
MVPLWDYLVDDRPEGEAEETVRAFCGKNVSLYDPYLPQNRRPVDLTRNAPNDNENDSC